MPPTRDPDALLAALVLAPSTYPRNRFFPLYQDPALRRVRKRAAELRSLVRQLARTTGAVADIEASSRDEAGAWALCYRVDALNLRVRVLLRPLEAAIIDVALARVRDQAPPAEAEAVVEGLLLRLGERSEPRRSTASA